MLLHKTSEKSLGSCIKDSHKLSLIQGLPPPALCINDSRCLRLRGWWLIWPSSYQWKSFWPSRSRPRRTSSLFSFNFCGHAEGGSCFKDSFWLFLIQEPSDFSLVSWSTFSKNSLQSLSHSASYLVCPVWPRSGFRMDCSQRSSKVSYSLSFLSYTTTAFNAEQHQYQVDSHRTLTSSSQIATTAILLTFPPHEQHI